MPALGDEIGAEERAAQLEATCRRLQRQLAAAKQRNEDIVEAVMAGARDAAVVVGTPKPVRAPKKDRRRRGLSHGLLHLTDWQLGKETTDYNTEVCEERVRRAVAKTIKITEIQRADHPVPVCHVMLGGDLVENVDTFPLQAFEVDSTTFEQVFRAAALVEQVIITLLEHFEAVEVWEVSGNHGRIGRKGQYPREDNFDRILGRIARERLSEQDRLTWHIPHGWYQIVEAGRYRCLLVHGDQIRGGGGQVPHYGVAKRVNAWAAGVVEPFHDAYLGHYHQNMQLTLSGGGINGGGRAFMTGSTESSSEYAREFVAAKGSPSQRLHFVDPEAGRVTAEYILWLD